jgi:hypothetical protein
VKLHVTVAVVPEEDTLTTSGWPGWLAGVVDAHVAPLQVSVPLRAAGPDPVIVAVSVSWVPGAIGVVPDTVTESPRYEIETVVVPIVPPV